MSQHKEKEKEAKRKEAFKEKIRNYLVSNNTTFGSFRVIDDGDWTSKPNNNDSTNAILNELKNLCSEYSGESAKDAVREVLDDIGCDLAFVLNATPIPYDKRFASQICNDEGVLFVTARLYRYVINLKLPCYESYHFSSWVGYWKTLIANNDKSMTDFQKNIVKEVDAYLKPYTDEMKDIILYNVDKLLIKRIDSLKLKENLEWKN